MDFSLFDVQQVASCTYEGRECSQTSSPQTRMSLLTQFYALRYFLFLVTNRGILPSGMIWNVTSLSERHAIMCNMPDLRCTVRLTTRVT